jgi:hypothetical protein
MPKQKKIPETHFITVKVEFVYEQFARTKSEAEDKFMKAFCDLDSRRDMIENCFLEIVKVENAHEHLGPAE